jgi:hypothetical protein
VSQVLGERPASERSTLFVARLVVQSDRVAAERPTCEIDAARAAELDVDSVPFLMDRYEVTNAAFQEFVDAGGYHDAELWRHAFVESDRRLSFEHTMSRLRDETGRPGGKLATRHASAGRGGFSCGRRELVRGGGLLRVFAVLARRAVRRGHSGGVDYLVMEYLEGESLEERLRRGPPPDRRRGAHRLRDRGGGGSRAPAGDRASRPQAGNLLLTPTGTKVVDFGVAREIAPAGGVDTAATTLAAAVTEDGRVAGTLLYMAPEQLDGKPATPRSDIWALGCILYEMTTGERPFRGEGRAS